MRGLQAGQKRKRRAVVSPAALRAAEGGSGASASASGDSSAEEFRGSGRSASSSGRASFPPAPPPPLFVHPYPLPVQLGAPGAPNERIWGPVVHVVLPGRGSL